MPQARSFPFTVKTVIPAPELAASGKISVPFDFFDIPRKIPRYFFGTLLGGVISFSAG